MIIFEKAFNIVIDQATLMSAERVKLSDATGRILAESVISDIDMPPFNKSAVDGFACRAVDLESELEILETIPAGKSPEYQIARGKSSRIMTGAMVPDGADCVFMVEDSEINDQGKVRFTKNISSNNICLKGEDLRKGDKVLNTGTLLQPQHLACLAAVGVAEPLVYKKVKIAIISTGDELVNPQTKPEGSAIRDSNSYQLIGQVLKAGAIPDFYGIAGDKENVLEDIISSATKKNDIVILSGGVSMGDFDFVPSVLQNLGFEILIKSIAIQPGKPTIFARKGEKYVFGLPGNPVSSFVLFELLVKPFIKKMEGEIYEPFQYRIASGADFIRKKTERKAIIPVMIKNDMVFPVEYHGSAHINSYTIANGMIMMEIGEKEIRKGDLVYVRPL